VEVLLILFGGLYFILIFLFTIGWFRIKKSKSSIDSSIMASIIIAMRNEEASILFLLEDLKNQSYPFNKFEILIVDDHSKDMSFELVFNFRKSNPNIPIKLLTAKGCGKKEAIKQAVYNSIGDVIITTDADCRIKSNWIASILAAFDNPKTQFVSGPVNYHKEKTLFEKIQSIEFLSLIASGAGAIGIKLPLMCNGANLAFKKNVFIEINGFEGNSKLASGDDVFLLHKIKKVYGASAIRFLKSRDAIVYTEALKVFNNLLRQRKRWVSKSTAYKDGFTITTGIVVALFNSLIIFSLFCGIINFRFLELVVYSIIFKVIIDFVLMFSVGSFLQRKSLMWIYLPIQLIYPVYTSLITFLAFFTKNEWKCRKI
jgi:cellulose synthase/poly-beta-1,6-N-acetylglucosamine synthase-like glycosyltransferase